MKKYLYKHRLAFLLNIIITILYTTVYVLVAFIFKMIFDILQVRDISKYNEILIISILYLIVFFITGLLRRVLKAKLIKDTLVDLKNDIFYAIIKKEIADFDDDSSAYYLSTLNNDIKMIEDDYFKNILDMIISIYSFALSSILLIRLNIYIAAAVFAISIMTILIPKLFEKPIMNSRKKYSEKLENFNLKIKDILIGFEIIKSFNLTNVIDQIYKNANIEVENSKYNFTKLSSFVDMLSYLFGISMNFIAILIGTYMALKGIISVGTMIAATQLMNNIVNPILEFTESLNRLKSVKLIIDKVNNLIISNKPHDYEALIEIKNFIDKIEFKDIAFELDNKVILDKISLQINKYGKYAIIGASGSGKSTLIKLLLNYYKNYNGTILIDGIDVKQIDSNSLFKLVTLIHQNIFLFEGTIKDNITLFENYSINEINDAIRIAGLEDLINKLPNGIYSNLGENGKLLSGGERQRIAIARALIKNTPILILDEATSALDNELAYSIEDTVLNLKEKTIITITHKLYRDALRRYDKIFVIKNGQIVEEGTFDELMNCKGYFYSLYSLQ